MKKIILLILFVTSALLSENIQAQAYDGDEDSHIHFGYIRIKDASGIELQSDSGIGDVFSYGFRINYLLIEDPETIDFSGVTQTIKIEGINKLIGAGIKVVMVKIL